MNRFHYDGNWKTSKASAQIKNNHNVVILFVWDRYPVLKSLEYLEMCGKWLGIPRCHEVLFCDLLCLTELGYALSLCCLEATSVDAFLCPRSI